MLEGPAIPALALGGGNNVAFRKTVFRKVGLFLESLGSGTRLNHAEDNEFSCRVLFYRCKVVHTPVPLVQHDKWLDSAGFADLMKGGDEGSCFGVLCLFPSSRPCCFRLSYENCVLAFPRSVGHRLGRNGLEVLL